MKPKPIRTWRGGSHATEKGLLKKDDKYKYQNGDEGR
jgi:hypothetical protein